MKATIEIENNRSVAASIYHKYIVSNQKRTVVFCHVIHVLNFTFDTEEANPPYSLFFSVVKYLHVYYF